MTLGYKIIKDAIVSLFNITTIKTPEKNVKNLQEFILFIKIFII